MSKPNLITTDLFSPQDLGELNTRIAVCESCSIPGPCINTLHGGSLFSGILCVGEAPGAKEIETGRPFSGRAGKEFDRLLLSAGLFRDDIYTSNVVRARPMAEGKNRAPKASEANACLPHLLNEVAILKPKVIVCLGGTAVNALMNPQRKALSITRVRGTLMKIGGQALVATFHPSFVMRSKRIGNRGPERDVIADLRMAKKVAEEKRWVVTSSKGSQCLWEKPTFMGSCSIAHAAYLKAEAGYVERFTHRDTKVFLDGTELERSKVNIIEESKGRNFYILAK